MILTYSIRQKEYRGKTGWVIGSRGGIGWPISIFVQDRADAELIRDAYNAARDGFITPEECDAYVTIAFHQEQFL